MAIVKLFLLIVMVVAQWYGTTPPNARPPTEQLRAQRGTEVLVSPLAMLYRVLTLTWALFEVSVLFALSDHCPPALARLFHHALHHHPPTAPLISVPTPALCAGTALALSGALLRAHCFATLGQHFTFELAIRPAHALITRGAYGVVRHPSYAGVTGLAVGWMLWMLDPRGVGVGVVVARIFGWGFGEEGGGGTMGTAVLACTWATGLGLMFVGMHKRMDKEDAMLEDNFGEEWRAWARRVPYRLVPGVY